MEWALDSLYLHNALWHRMMKATNDVHFQSCHLMFRGLKQILRLCHWLWPLFILVTFLNFKWPICSASPEYELGTSRFSYRIMSSKYIRLNMVNQSDLKPLYEISETDTGVTYIIIEKIIMKIRWPILGKTFNVEFSPRDWRSVFVTKSI